MLSNWSVRSQWNGRLHFTVHAFSDQVGMQCCGSCARIFLVGSIQGGPIKILALLIQTLYEIVSATA